MVFNKKYWFKRLIADVYYEDVLPNSKPFARFLLAPVENSEKPFVLFVIAKDGISPMQYPNETWTLIYNFLESLKIPVHDLKIYLDYEERYGASRTNLSNWEFRYNKSTYLGDSLTDLLHDDLPTPVKKIREDYYREHVYENNIDTDLINYKRKNLY
ncbi:MAG TPA: hypothetical protein VEY70_13165 [Metabacillus sp.]|nr:hypothetical protein [Metabacillus sp.]